MRALYPNILSYQGKITRLAMPRDGHARIESMGILRSRAAFFFIPHGTLAHPPGTLQPSKKTL
jgi:hypothetical protein